MTRLLRRRTLFCLLATVALLAGTNAQAQLAPPASGSLVGWGVNWDGMTFVLAGNDFAANASGAKHGLALRADGSLVGWGDNYFGATDGLMDAALEIIGLLLE